MLSQNDGLEQQKVRSSSKAVLRMCDRNLNSFAPRGSDSSDALDSVNEKPYAGSSCRVRGVSDESHFILSKVCHQPPLAEGECAQG